MDNKNILNQIQEAERDGLVAYFLHNIIPTRPQLENLILTENDLYEYLLIDVQVSGKVVTTKIAQAIASYQQHLNGIYQHIEPGYYTSVLDGEKWRNYLGRFPIWAANQVLRYYPENYIDPTLRIGKTKLFSELETRLNQGRINEDIVQQVVQSYLNDFEEISNLKLISGYQNGINQKNDIYYFIGCTRTMPYQFYWRQLDVGRRSNDIISSSSWSEWKKIDIALTDKTLISTVRPIIMNNRLYVVWLDISTQPLAPEEVNGPKIYTAGIYIAYKKFDDTWSPPQLLKESVSETRPTINHLIAVVDRYSKGANDPELVLIAINGQTPVQNTSLLYVCDMLFNTTRETLPALYYTRLTSYFADSSIIQYPYTGSSYIIKNISTNTPENNKYSSSINNVSASYDELSKKITLTVLCKSTILSVGNVTGYREHFSEPRITVSKINNNSITLQCTGGELSTTIAIFKNDVLLPNNWIVQYGTTITIIIPISAPCMLTLKAIYKRDVTIGEYTINITEINVDKTLLKILDIDNNNVQLAKKSEVIANNVTTYEFESSPINLDTKLVHNFSIRFSGPQVDYGSSTTRLTFEEAPNSISPIKIITNEKNNAQYLDISSLQFSTYKSIRLNTLFGKELISRANISIDKVLKWDTQLVFEPTIPNPMGGLELPIQTMDFYSANGLYFWELFFHLPFLVAWRLNQEQRYLEATRWIHYIFNPHDNGFNNIETNIFRKKYWYVLPLISRDDPVQNVKASERVFQPADPDAIAITHPIYYRKAVFLFYLRNIKDQGDTCYRELTPDGINAAKLWYVSGLDLLGYEPSYSSDAIEWKEISLNDAKNSNSIAMRNYEEEDFIPQLTTNLAVVHDDTLRASDTELFHLSLNLRLLEQRKIFNERLYNLRHSLTLDGKPMYLPTFALPMDPRQLQISRNNSGSNSLTTMPMVAIPPFRFTIMFNQAQQAVELLIQYGNSLLSMLERKDNLDYEQKQLKDQSELFIFTLELEQNSLEMAKLNKKSLEFSKSSIEKRYHHYKNLYDENISVGELMAIDLRTHAQIIGSTVTITNTAASIIDTIPNIFGTAAGGAKYSAPVHALAAGLSLEADILNLGAMWIENTEIYRRRRQEWEIQYKQTEQELNQIIEQINQQDLLIKSSNKQLEQIKAQQQHLKNTLEFYNTRFTGTELYQWLSNQLMALYFQAHDSVVSLCLSTQAALQMEMAEFNNSFIDVGTWHDKYKGLLSGERLKLCLLRMDQAYLTRNERRLEIIKTISLKELKGNAWQDALTNLQDNGSIEFDLTQQLFDEDYPSHYLRQIATISISFPSVSISNQEIRATLVQTTNSLLLKPDIENVKYLYKIKPSDKAYIVNNIRANQQIALSSGYDDVGMFAINFYDDRYLPFEGSGAISEWKLQFPNHKSVKQAKILLSITDVIIKVLYKSKDGGEMFGTQVKQLRDSLKIT